MFVNDLLLKRRGGRKHFRRHGVCLVFRWHRHLSKTLNSHDSPLICSNETAAGATPRPHLELVCPRVIHFSAPDSVSFFGIPLVLASYFVNVGIR